MGWGVMGTTEEHRRCAEQCVARAQSSREDGYKALWLSLAQSWVRLAEHSEQQSEAGVSEQPDADEALEEAEPSRY